MIVTLYKLSLLLLNLLFKGVLQNKIKLDTKIFGQIAIIMQILKQIGLHIMFLYFLFCNVILDSGNYYFDIYNFEYCALNSFYGDFTISNYILPNVYELFYDFFGEEQHPHSIVSCRFGEVLMFYFKICHWGERKVQQSVKKFIIVLVGY